MCTVDFTWLGAVRVQKSNFTLNMGDFGGVSFVFQDSTLVFESCEFLSNVAEFDGVIRVRQQSAVTFIGGIFKNNTADSGGVVYAQDSNVTIETSSFDYNSARQKGGTLYADTGSTVSIYYSNFSNNRVEEDGGVMTLLGGSITTIKGSEFTGSRAHSNGGVIGIQESHVWVLNSTFDLSTAGSSGGIMHAINSSIRIDNSSFTENSAQDKGGAIDARSNSSVMILCSYFTNNTAKKSGGVLYLEEQSNAIVGNSIFQQNKADHHGGVIAAFTMSEVSIAESAFSYNTAEMGAVLTAAQRSSISFDSFLFSCSDESRVIANGAIQIHNNTAVYGGGVYVSKSNLYFGIETNISHNRAITDGGGIYAVLCSFITIDSPIYFDNNQANGGSGGGISAANSSVIIGSTVHFESNQATHGGGGVSLKNSTLHDMIDGDKVSDINFVLNRADYGGALYVDDKYECSKYAISNKVRCFFQDLTNINFKHNSANSSTRGHDLYGGILDRCTVVSDTNSSEVKLGAARFKEISRITSFNTIRSEPVRVCLCKGNKSDCSQQAQPVTVKQGNEFTIGPIAAVDQVEHPVTATVVSSFNQSDLTLSVNEMSQKVGMACSNLTYQVTFPSAPKEYELILHAQGPCNDKGISSFVVNVHVIKCSCAIGFIRNKHDVKCTCVCDTDTTFSKYITMCSSSTESVIRKGDLWITYLNDSDDNSSSPYLIYPYCPLDYCQSSSKSVAVSLNLPNGADAQCANNRRGLLCGKCQSNYSLSLGSSKCIECPDNWYGFLVGIIAAALLAGIMIVSLLLMLNLTVAVGTLNSIIFYANIIDANRSIYFSQSHLTFVPVFISWLNLDIGFDTCFFEGMDTYAKTWLQLAFPVYIIFLVILIIWVSSCSSKFSNLIGKRNPAATLATLILLSYTNLLETIIASLSFVPLKYPNGTTQIKWLPDATVEYGKGKHVALIFVAILILIFGLLYTILIFSWQWLLHCPRSKFFKWTRNQKLHSFINTYHTPHTAKHRYWTGLLLLVRVIVYLISAFSVSVDPHITLLSTVVITSCLLLYKAMLMIKLYRNWLLNAMESYVYFNLIIFASFTWYTFDDFENSSRNKEILQGVAAYISVGTIFVLFLLVIIFHVYRYGSAKIYSFGQDSKVGRKMKAQLSHEENQDHRTPLDSTLLDIIDSPREDVGYQPPLQSCKEPTSSVVSMTDCDEASTTEHPQAQDAESVDKISFQQRQNNQSYGDRGGKGTDFMSSSTMVTDFEVTRKTKPKLLSFSSQGTPNESITKPLLEDDKL